MRHNLHSDFFFNNLIIFTCNIIYNTYFKKYNNTYYLTLKIIIILYRVLFTNRKYNLNKNKKRIHQKTLIQFLLKVDNIIQFPAYRINFIHRFNPKTFITMENNTVNSLQTFPFKFTLN